MDRLHAAAIAVPGVEVRVVERCGSTNDLLLREAPENPLLIAAEEQTAGRGRRGRRWHSAPGAGITFSLGRRIARPVRELAALSLVAGVAATRALRALGAHQAALKWPNDLVVDGAKLGGILVETRSSHAVIGIGINCRSDATVEAIDQFEKNGLDALRAEWEAMHAYAGQKLRVRLADGRTLSGTATGLGADGSLQLHTRQGMRSVTSGRVVSARSA